MDHVTEQQLRIQARRVGAAGAQRFGGRAERLADGPAAWRPGILRHPLSLELHDDVELAAAAPNLDRHGAVVRRKGQVDERVADAQVLDRQIGQPVGQ